MSEADTLPQGGTDSAQPSASLDNPANWDYYDPDDEKQDTVVAPKPAGTEGEPDANAESVQEAAQSDETQEVQTEEADEPEGTPAKTVDDSVTVKLPDGKEVTVAELRKGYLRQEDYSRKRQVAAQREAEIGNFHRQSQEIFQAAQAYLQNILPPRPDPALAISEPAKFVAMQAQHQQAVDALNYAYQMQAQAQEAEAMRTKSATEEQLQEEFSKTAERLPHFRDPSARAKFREKVVEFARAEGVAIGNVLNLNDHQAMVILDYAIEGRAARKARQTAKAKAQNVPPALPQKQRISKPDAAKNRDAMARLSRSGSIYDAMAVDFD